MKRIIFSCCLLSVFSSSAFAINLQQAKQQGLVGETREGFVATIKQNKNEDVKQLITTVNNHRKEMYLTISQSHDLSLIDVKRRAYRKAIEKTQLGNFYQNSAGSWQKKKH